MSPVRKNQSSVIVLKSVMSVFLFRSATMRQRFFLQSQSTSVSFEGLVLRGSFFVDDKFYKFRYAVLVAPCKKQFLHKHVIGVEIRKWPEKRCTRQSALNAERNAKSPSNLTQADPYTAESAGPRNEAQVEDSRLANPLRTELAVLPFFPF